MLSHPVLSPPAIVQVWSKSPSGSRIVWGAADEHELEQLDEELELDEKAESQELELLQELLNDDEQLLEEELNEEEQLELDDDENEELELENELEQDEEKAESHEDDELLESAGALPNSILTR